jgi:hypothetical protein
MSEYQYYEFVAVDRPLSEEKLRALRALSTRARITSTRFVNHYDWGSFGGDPNALMEDCFDLFVHVANWGTRCFMMRLPRQLFDDDATQPYLSAGAAGDACAAWATDAHVILRFEREDIYEDGSADYEFDDGSGWLAALAPLRQELMEGDLRCLYLAWLLCAQTGLVDEKAPEPPVPPGMTQPSAALQAFADFMALDPDLLSVAAEAGAGEPPADPSRREIEDWIDRLSDRQKTEMLVRLVAGGDPHLSLELRRRCRLSRSPAAPEATRVATPRRSAAELLEAAGQRAAERARLAAELEAAERVRQEREAALAREEALRTLSARAEAAWRDVEAFASSKRPDDYDRAVTLLIDLRAVAERAASGNDFGQRIDEIRARHRRKRSFLERLSQAGLIGRDR